VNLKRLFLIAMKLTNNKWCLFLTSLLVFQLVLSSYCLIDYHTKFSYFHNETIFKQLDSNTQAIEETEIIGAEPREVFVHRNIANMVVHSDMNLLSVLDYAVNVLQVKHIIVCGHYGCGGVQTAMTNKHVGIIDNWIRHIKDVYRFHQKELNDIEDEKARFNRFVELNVMEQVLDLAKTSIVQGAWESGQEVHVHGWVYDVKDGLINDLKITIKDNKNLSAVYKLDL
jgi:carbonic anhydrase